MDKKREDPEQQEPVLDITDDLKETKPEEAEDSSEADELVNVPQAVIDPVPSVEAEPTSRPTEPQVISGSGKVPFKQKLKAFLSTKKGKVIAIVSAVVLVIAVLLAIPATRYAILGVFIQKDVSLTVLDSVSKKPVSGATVTLGVYSATSGADGVAKITGVPVGEYTLHVQKKYYEVSTSAYTVPVISNPVDTKPMIKATGREVTINVHNKVTGACIMGATVTVSGSSATSDKTCDIGLILPVQSTPQKGTVKVKGYNDATFEITVKNAENQNMPVDLTPSGKIYFLSKRTGKIDVMKSDLDGGNVEAVVTGTGKESDTGTVLLSTTDWKYLALLASRDSDKPKLYLIDTASGKLSTMDDGDVEFQLVGWSGHQFVFQTTRSQNLWVDQRQALKSFNAETAKLATLDETDGSGTNFSDYASQTIANVYADGNAIVYTKAWDVAQLAANGDKQSSIMSVDVNGTGKKSLKDFPITEVSYFDGRLYSPGEIYYRAAPRDTNKTATFYEYEEGKVAATADTNDNKFYNAFYATYLISPSGNKTLWYEPRDGRNVIFVGDKSGNNGKEIGTSDYTPYGWYLDEYALFSRVGSELYIFGASDKLDDDHKPLKITDYHKPAITYPGYGGGYGGQ